MEKHGETTVDSRWSHYRGIKISIGVISLIKKVSLGLFLIARHPAGDSADKMCDFIHDSTESQVIGTPIPRIRVTRKRRPRDAKPMSQSVFAATLAK
jgi:hypothetical protein